MHDFKDKCGYCDLHVHSYFSDGTLSPTAIVDSAAEIGLRAVALTDHNTTAGLEEFTCAAEARGIEAVCGVEFSTDYGERELHVLGLFIEPCHYPEINARLEAMHRRKDESNRLLIKSLRERGLNISYEEVQSSTKGHINRAHVAAVLFEHGYASSVKDAFKKYLDPRVGIYVPPKRLDVFDTIKFIESIGAVSVLAHPFVSLDGEEDVSRFLTEAVPCGLSAMETRYSTYSEQTERAALRLAERFSILESGGSDYHADKKPDISLGTGRGTLAVPYSVLKALKKKRDKNRVG